MCMLCVVPPNVLPERDKLENSALNNPHGFGYAIAIPKENRIHSFRTMNPDECISRFLEDRGKYPEGYAIWHARFATNGTTDLSNCHPFMVGDDPDTWLAHNGILSVIESAHEYRSDTRIFAEDLLPSIGGVKALDNPQVWNMLEDFTTGSKVAVLTVNPEARHQLYLLHEEKGEVDKSGVWWSNNTCYLTNWYSKYDTKISKSLTPYDDDEGTWLECHVCDGVFDYWDSLKTGDDSYCRTCGSCFGCGITSKGCLCYQGNAYRSSYDYRTLQERYGGWAL